MLQLLVALVCVGPLAADDAKPELSQRFGVVHSGPDFLVELGSGWNRFAGDQESVLSHRIT